jgi:type VI secretion system secreted protein VgrG
MSSSNVNPKQATREFEVTCALGKDVLLFSTMNGHDQLGDLFQYNLTLLSENGNIAVDDILGTSLTVRIGALKDPRYFNGVVTQFSIAGNVGRFAAYHAVLRPSLWLLSRTTDSRFFKDMTVPAIVKQICKKYGVLVNDTLAGSYASLPYIVQYRESDLDFVIRLMEHHGITFYFKHTKSEHYLVLADANSSHPVLKHPIEYHFPENLTPQGEDVVFSWSVTGEIQASEQVVNEFDYERFSPSKSKALQITKKSKPPYKLDRYQHFDYPGDYITVATGTTIDRAHVDRLEGQTQEVRASSNVWIFESGKEFELTLHPRNDQNTKYFITRAEYDIDAGFYVTGAHGTESSEYHFFCDIRAVEAKVVYLPPRTKTKPVVRGPQTAVVLGPPGEEIHTDDLGRIKVRFHWERASGHTRGADGVGNSFDHGERSCWVRVAQTWAGKAWGSVFIPRIGQEVVVSFLEGDPDRPLVTGSVYNSDNAPALRLPKHKTRSTIKSNSSKGGRGYNEFRFEDKTGAEQVFTHAEKDLESYVKNDTLEWVGNDRHLIVKKDQFEKIEGNQNLTVRGNKREAITGDSSVRIRGDRKEKVTGKSSFKAAQQHSKALLDLSLEAGTTAHVKAGTVLVLEAQTLITLKVGGIALNITPAGIFVSSMPIPNQQCGTIANAEAVACAALALLDNPDAPEAPKLADDGTK